MAIIFKTKYKIIIIINSLFTLLLNKIMFNTFNSGLKAGKNTIIYKYRIGKRINLNAFAIKKLLNKGYSQVRISRILGLKNKKLVNGSTIR